MRAITVLLSVLCTMVVVYDTLAAKPVSTTTVDAEMQRYGFPRNVTVKVDSVLRSKAVQKTSERKDYADSTWSMQWMPWTDAVVVLRIAYTAMVSGNDRKGYAVMVLLHRNSVASVVTQTLAKTGSWTVRSAVEDNGYAACARHIAAVTGVRPLRLIEYHSDTDVLGSNCGPTGQPTALTKHLAIALNTADTTWLVAMAAGPNITRSVGALLVCRLLVERKTLSAERLSILERYVASKSGSMRVCSEGSGIMTQSVGEFLLPGYSAKRQHVMKAVR